MYIYIYVRTHICVYIYIYIHTYSKYNGLLALLRGLALLLPVGLERLFLALLACIV